MKPLEGIRILDFTQFMAGPMATMLLSDMGAEVIKFENASTGGDNTRYGKFIKDGASSHYATRNRGKKSVAINMKDPKQVEFFLRLVKDADAVIENYKPGTMEKFGVTYDRLKEINPKITYVRISGYGQTGPYADHAAFDATVQAEAGIMSITGPEGSDGFKCGASVGDYSGALLGAFSVAMGIVSALRSGEGCCVDLSMMDALIFMQENQLSVYKVTGKLPKPSGNRYPAASPIGDFMCKDGIPVMLNISTDKQWADFAKVLGQPQWLEDPDFVSMSKRAENFRKVEAEVLRVFADMTSDEVCEKLQSVQAVYGRINNYETLVNHPQVLYRKTFVNANYANGISYSVPGKPLNVVGMERQMDYGTAAIGENTMEIMGQVCTPEELEQVVAPVQKLAEEKAAALYAKS